MKTNLLALALSVLPPNPEYAALEGTVGAIDWATLDHIKSMLLLLTAAQSGSIEVGGI